VAPPLHNQLHKRVAQPVPPLEHLPLPPDLATSPWIYQDKFAW
jgi:hypothetical protein